MTSEVRLSSKGQVVLPKDLRKKLGLKKGDRLKVELENGNKIVMQPTIEPPEDIFVHAGTRLTKRILEESREIDETKFKGLLKEIRSGTR